MTGEDDFGPIADQVLDGGHGRPDPGVVGDVAVLVEGNVQIRPDEYLLPLEVGGGEVPHALLGHGRHPARPLPAPPGHGPDLRRHVSRQKRVGRGPGETQPPNRRTEGYRAGE